MTNSSRPLPPLVITWLLSHQVQEAISDSTAEPCPGTDAVLQGSMSGSWLPREEDSARAPRGASVGKGEAAWAEPGLVIMKGAGGLHGICVSAHNRYL